MTEPTGIGAEPLKPRPTSSSTEETDGDLLCLIGWAEDGPEEAKAAFEEFYNRHVESLYAACYRTYRGRLPVGYSVQDLVVDTFARAAERGQTYDVGTAKDGADRRLRTEGWLLAIAHSVVGDSYRGRFPVEVQLPDEGWQCRAFTDRPVDSAETKLVRQAIDDVLDDREREVILVTFHWYDPDREHQRLPNEVAAELAAQLGTTTDNLRKIRAKAVRKVKEHVLAYRHNLQS